MNVPIKTQNALPSLNGKRPIALLGPYVRPPFYQRWLRRLPHKEDILVVEEGQSPREIKSAIVVPQWLMVIILGVIVTMCYGFYNARQTDHDLLIKLATQREDEIRLNEQMQSENRAWRDVISNRLAKVEVNLGIKPAQIPKEN